MSDPIDGADRIKWTDTVQAVCTIGLLALAAFGYYWSVLPNYSKSQLEEEAAKLKKEVSDYTNNLRQFAIAQFLGKVQSEAQSYKCSPTVFDRGFGNRSLPIPKTGDAVIEDNLKNSEFTLLHDPDRINLIDSIVDFVKRRDPTGGFAATLEIQHSAFLTGPLAAVQKRDDLFRFSQAERDQSGAAFGSFDKSMTALQAYLLPDVKTPIRSKPCPNLGLAPN
jgi:hypothetical protein